jgi:hypothetical protein
MANSDAPFGAKPIGTTDGSDYHGKLRRIHFLAGTGNAIFLGDFLAPEAGGADATGTMPSMQLATVSAGNVIAGALTSLDPDFTDEGSLTQRHRTASTARTGQMAWGKEVLYVMQEDSVGGSIAATSVGLNTTFVNTAGSTVTGISAQELDSSEVATTATEQLRIHHLHEVAGNALGTNANWVVSINNSSDGNIVAGV